MGVGVGDVVGVMDAGLVSAGGLVAVDIVLLGPLESVFFESFFPPVFFLLFLVSFLSSSLRAMICGQEKIHENILATDVLVKEVLEGVPASLEILIDGFVPRLQGSCPVLESIMPDFFLNLHEFFPIDAVYLRYPSTSGIFLLPVHIDVLEFRVSET